MPVKSCLLTLLALFVSAATLSCNAVPPAPQRSSAGPHSTSSPSRQTSFTPAQPHQIEDPVYNIPYGTLTVPAGWLYNGGVVHAQTCAVSGPSAAYALQSPDGEYGIIVAPELLSIATNDPAVVARMQQRGCQQNGSASAADFIRAMFLPHLGLENMRIDQTGPSQALQDAEQHFRQQQQQFAAMTPNSQFMQHRSSVDTAEVHVSFQAHGHTMDGLVRGLITCEDTRIAFPGQRAAQQRLCTAEVLAFAFAPAGEIDKIANARVYTMQQNPVWTQHYQQLANNQLARNAQIIQQNQNAQIQRGNALMDAQRQRYEAGMDAAHASANATHESAQAYAAHNGDYNDYTNLQTGQVTRSSNQYSNTYTDSSGTVMLQTNQPGTPGVDWSMMVPRFK